MNHGIILLLTALLLVGSVHAQVEQMCADQISFTDSVPPENPPQESPRNF